jgi:hexulose-6-phosphate isomerase
MIKAINFWSFPGGLDGKKDVKQAIKEARILGYEGIELSFGDSGTLSPSTTADEIREIIKTAKAEKIKLSSLCAGFYWAYNFASSKPEDRKKAIEMTKKYIDTAEALGVEKILVIPAAVDVFFNPAAEVISYEDAYSRSVAALEQLVPYAEKKKVVLGVENVWNRFLSMSVLEMKNFVDIFNSKYLGVYFDVGNVIPFGYSEQWIRILGKRIIAVHFKDFKREAGNGGMVGFVDLLSGDVNWPEVMKALKETGYNGPLTAEMIPYYRYHPEVRLKVTSIAMDTIMGRR